MPLRSIWRKCLHNLLILIQSQIWQCKHILCSFNRQIVSNGESKPKLINEVKISQNEILGICANLGLSTCCSTFQPIHGHSWQRAIVKHTDPRSVFCDVIVHESILHHYVAVVNNIRSNCTINLGLSLAIALFSPLSPALSSAQQSIFGQLGSGYSQTKK